MRVRKAKLRQRTTHKLPNIPSFTSLSTFPSKNRIGFHVSASSPHTFLSLRKGSGSAVVLCDIKEASPVIGADGHQDLLSRRDGNLRDDLSGCSFNRVRQWKDIILPGLPRQVVYDGMEPQGLLQRMNQHFSWRYCLASRTFSAACKYDMLSRSSIVNSESPRAETSARL